MDANGFVGYLKVVHVFIRSPASSRTGGVNLGKRVGMNILQMGYPTKKPLRSLYRKYEQCHQLRPGYTLPAKFPKR